jgi:hypothetical protein
LAKDDKAKTQLDADVILLQGKCKELEDCVHTWKDKYDTALHSLRIMSKKLETHQAVLTRLPLDVNEGYCNNCGKALGSEPLILNNCGAVSEFFPSYS